MKPDQYPSNSNMSGSNKPAPEEKKVEKVISGVATTKKRSTLGRMAENFVSEDVTNFKEYMFKKILIPAAKKAISDTVATVSDMFMSGINTILWGDAGRNMSRLQNGNRITPYSSYWNSSGLNINNQRQPVSPVTTSLTSHGFGINYDDVCTETRPEAESIISQMDELIDKFGMVSIADMYDLAGMRCDYTYNNYGWTDIKLANAVRETDGRSSWYRIKMPRAISLK